MEGPPRQRAAVCWALGVCGLLAAFATALPTPQQQQAAQAAAAQQQQQPDPAVVTYAWRRGAAAPVHTLDFAVIGQMKCGTSSLWRYLSEHPGIVAPRRKELLYFMGIVERCQSSVLYYYDEVYRRIRHRQLRPNLKLGDFTATYLSCSCCPPLLQQINPNLKIVVILRHPIARALSRFREAKAMKLPYYIPNTTFAGTVEQAMANITTCLMRANMRFGGLPRKQGPILGANLTRTDAEAYHGRASSLLDNDTFAGIWSSRFAPNPGLLQLVKVQCAKLDNFIGLSMYDLYIEHYLMYFPPQNMKVVFMEQLDADPVSVLRGVETFLGLQPHEFNPDILSLRFHSADCIGWHIGCNSTSSTKTRLEAQQQLGDELYGRLVQFFRPGLEHLQRLSKLGFIDPIPSSYYS